MSDYPIIQIISHGWSERGRVLLGLDSKGDIWTAEVKLEPLEIRWKLLRNYQ